MDLLIRQAHVIDPKNNRDEVCDIRIKKGKINQIGKSLDPTAEEEVIEAKGYHLFPGLIDLHAHFREPGFEGKETIRTGSEAALKGGFVAVVTMPNTKPAADNPGVIDIIMRKAQEVPFTIYPCGTISKGREGKELSEMADLKLAGIVAVSDDGDWVMDSLLMRRAMEYASMFDLIVISHPEDKLLTAGGVMNEGLSSTRLGLKGIPKASEEIAVARDIELARLCGGHLHLCHVSTARSVELIRRAKEEGIHVTADVTPHNLTLTDEGAEGYNTNFKMYPPLREKEDLEALTKALKDGVVDCVATDHAPHTPEDKMREFDQAPMGVIGLETALGVMLTEFYHGVKWPLQDIVRVMSQRPAEILKLNSGFGSIDKGKEANVTLVDVQRKWTVTPQEFRSKSRNSCFLKRELQGKVLATVCRGKLWKFEA
ncbi:MAG: dihydroorotase [Candidatus Omnitrophica bacterium]|nr:dihydroorotase [Candidatus Omnitrophota bacterium]